MCWSRKRDSRQSELTSDVLFHLRLPAIEPLGIWQLGWRAAHLALSHLPEAWVGLKHFKTNPTEWKWTKLWHFYKNLKTAVSLALAMSCGGNSPEKAIMLGRVCGKRKPGCQRMRWLETIKADTRQSINKLSRSSARSEDVKKPGP